jgi:hypothetical protein
MMPALQGWAAPCQRGFIAGRCPDIGILEIDTAARCTAITKGDQPGILALFDFAAAFPSISREFILMVLHAAGFPDWVSALAKVAWRGSRIADSDGNVDYDIISGVGQGCPASAVMFVVGVNPISWTINMQQRFTST